MGSSSGAVKQETFNSSAWSRAVGSGLRRRTRPPWRLRGGEAKTFQPPPPSPPPSLPLGRSMEKRMADFTAALDVEQFSAHLNDKYAVLQDLHATSDNLGWSSLILNGTQESQRQ